VLNEDDIKIEDLEALTIEIENSMLGRVFLDNRVYIDSL